MQDVRPTQYAIYVGIFWHIINYILIFMQNFVSVYNGSVSLTRIYKSIISREICI